MKPYLVEVFESSSDRLMSRESNQNIFSVRFEHFHRYHVHPKRNSSDKSEHRRKHRYQ